MGLYVKWVFEQVSVQSVFGEHMSFFCLWIYGNSPESGLISLTKPMNVSEYVLHRQGRQIEHEFVMFITYYTFDVDLIDLCGFTPEPSLYRNVVPAM